MFNTPLTNLQNNQNTTNVRTETEGAKVTLLENREKSPSSNRLSLTKFSSRHSYILLVICVSLVVSAILASFLIKKNNQISHFEQQTSQLKQQISQFKQQISELKQNTTDLDNERRKLFVV